MPVYEFKSPEGVNYYGEGASPEEAFRTAEERDPHEIAAMRTRQSVRHGAAAPEIEIPEAAKAVKRGEYGPLGEAAAESAGALASFALPGLSALGSALAPTATAGGMFDAEPDPKVRRSLQKQYDEAGPKGKREITAAFMAQQGKIAEERRGVEREAAERGETQKRREDWLSQNAEAIKSLKPQWQQQIQAAGSLPEAQEMFSRGMEERKKAGMTVAEAHPGLVGGLETAGMGLAALLPYRTAAKRLATVKEATTDAETAFKAAWGAGAKKSKGREAEAALAENILKETQKIWPVSAGKTLGETTIPWIFGQAPNFYDLTIGRLDSDPASQEKVERAWNNILSLGPLEQALLEGAAAVTVGTLVGMGGRDWKSTKARGQGVLDTFEGRRTSEAAAAAAREAKAAELRARRGQKPTLVPPVNPMAKPDPLAGPQDILSDPYAHGYGYGAN